MSFHFEVKLIKSAPEQTEDGSLSAVARIGVGQGSKIAGPIDSIELTESIEVLPTTEAARSSIEGGSWQN